MESPVEALIKRLGNKIVDRGEVTQVTLQAMQLAGSGLETYEIDLLAVLLTIHQRTGYNKRTCIVFQRGGKLVSDMYWDIRTSRGGNVLVDVKNPMQSRIFRAGITTKFYEEQEPGEYVVLLKDFTPTHAPIPKHWLVPYA